MIKKHVNSKFQCIWSTGVLYKTKRGCMFYSFQSAKFNKYKQSESSNYKGINYIVYNKIAHNSKFLMPNRY